MSETPEQKYPNHPERIFADPCAGWGPEKAHQDDVEYIRADITFEAVYGSQALVDQLRSELEQARADKADLLEALKGAKEIAKAALQYWDTDQDAKVGKTVMAMAGELPKYRADTDSLHAILAKHATGTEGDCP
jgi:hypothetical protein